MKPIDARQQLGALMVAVGVTFSIVWALAGYAYAAPSAGASLTAKQIGPVRACS
jgi:hypothetical protein